MAATLFMDLADALAATLSASPALASGEIYLNRADVLAPSKVKCIKVNLGDSAQAEDSSLCADGGADWETEVSVEVLCRASAGSQAADLADELSADVYARAMADQTLGGLCSSMRVPVIARRVEQADTELASITLSFRLTHSTSGAAIT